jgi:biopolymer transport protein ExbD
MTMRFKKTIEEEPRLGITALIDIVFLLLIFFMLTSHFDVASGVLIKLPKAVQRLYGTENDRITLVIDSAGNTYLEGRKVDERRLQKRLQDLVERHDLVNLVLQADKDVKHGRVVQIMDLAKTAGVQSVIIAARWDSEKAL